MSLKPILKLALIGLSCGLCAGAAHYAMPTPAIKPTRISFRTPMAKDIHAKPNQAIQVRVRNIDDLPEDASQSMRLEVEVVTGRQFDSGVTGEWRLPAGVSIVEGASAPQTLELIPGETWKRVYTFKGITQASGKILQFEVAGNLNGQPIGGQGIFSSHPVQRDLSRKALAAKPAPGFFSKASAEETDRESSPRLPAGIQF